VVVLVFIMIENNRINRREIEMKSICIVRRENSDEACSGKIRVVFQSPHMYSPAPFIFLRVFPHVFPARLLALHPSIHSHTNTGFLELLYLSSLTSPPTIVSAHIYHRITTCSHAPRYSPHTHIARSTT